MPSIKDAAGESWPTGSEKSDRATAASGDQ
jgi:hypothetical protein